MKIKENVPMRSKMGRDPYLTVEGEDRIVQWILAKAKLGFPMHPNEVKDTVQRILNKTETKTPFLDNRPGSKWLSLFLRRHQNVRKRHSESISKARASVTEAHLREWFAGVITYLKEEKSMAVLEDGRRILNLDETGVQLCPKSGVILGPKNFKNLYEIAGGNEKESITVLCTFSANGDVLPPMIVYPFKRLPNHICQSVPEGWSIGNLIVILVVAFSRQLRSITNFFLANLAVADLCVGIFCVYQTLTNYLMPSWPLGDFLCKTYMFVNALSYTASIMILVVVCTERYLAIVHPIKCRSMRTRGRLRAIVGVVWILAAIYAAPKFIYVETIVHKLNSGSVDVMCIANIKKHNKNVIAAINLILLYLLPLILMCCLYTRIAVGLWKSGAAFGRPGLVARTKNGRIHHVHASSRNALRARRGVIRMLIAVVIMFAVCNLPQQARIVWVQWGPNYDTNSDSTTILTLSTFLISYMNSCLNPLLYAFLSRNFRKGMRELLNCNGRGRASVLRMGCTGGDPAHNDNGHTTNVPHSSVVRLSSAHDSPCTTHTITRQNTITGKTS